jgi:hypothetical protein
MAEETDWERELNLVEDQFIAELFSLTRFADADVITAGGLGRRAQAHGAAGLAPLATPELPEELEMARAIWASLTPAQHRRILAKTLACLSLPSAAFFQDASLFLLFVRPHLPQTVHDWVETALRDALDAAPSDLVALHKALVRVLYGVGGYGRSVHERAELVSSLPR